MITKRIYLVFPPGCSGNHLANMIALDDNVENRFETIEAMESWYMTDPMTKHPINSPTFNGFQNLNDVDAHVVKNATKTQVLCCHAHELAHAVSCGDLPVELLDDSVFILFSYPIEGSYVDRKHKSGPWIHGEHPDTHSFDIDDQTNIEMKDAYTKDKFIQQWSRPKRKAIDPDVVFEFDSEGLHGEFGFEYALAYINHLFGITFSKDAEKMHQIAYANWYKKWPSLLSS